MNGGKHYLAIDIGASSGRHIVGWKDAGKLKTEEIYRFPNGVTERDGQLTWDIDALTAHVKEGVEKAKARFGTIESLSIDTWGVDYVLLRGDEEVYPCYAYRDSRTEAVIPAVHEKLPFSELYRRTGIQFQPFNTIYQLYADKLAGRLESVTDFLMIPEYLMWKLCGVKAHEYTNATTGGMVNAETGEYDSEIIEALGLPKHLFCKRPLRDARHRLRRRRNPDGGQSSLHFKRNVVAFGNKIAKTHHKYCLGAGQLVQRGRRRLQPLSEEHHGHVARQPPAR